MATESSKYIVNPGPKKPVTGLKAAVTTDSAIVTETMINVLKTGGNAADAGIAGAMVQAAVEPFMTNHAGLVTFLYYEAKTGEIHQLDVSVAIRPVCRRFARCRRAWARTRSCLRRGSSRDSCRD